jgi:hypothetical protein
MLMPVLLALLSAGPSCDGSRVRLTDYLDEVCAEWPNGECAPLYAVASLIDSITLDGKTDAGSWCCKSCSTGSSGTTVTCGGCLSGGKSGWKCGASIKFADRPVQLDCPGTSVVDGETVTCGW